ANGRVQLSIIAALPCELTPAARLAVLQSFVAGEFETRGLPYHGVIHSPGPTNDARNFHAHVLYYDRPGTRDARGEWSFGTPGTDANGFPWGTEKPAARLKRLEAALAAAPETGKRRAKLERQLEEVRGFKPAPKATRTSKDRPTYPWGLEAAPSRAKRLARRIASAGDGKAAEAYRRQLAEVKAWQANPPPPAMTVGSIQWVRHLRRAWSDAANSQLAAEGINRRYSPDSYAALGIAATPAKPLGTRAAALEKKGVATPASDANTQIAIARRLAAGEPLAAITQAAALTTAANRKRHASRQLAAATGLGRVEDATAWQSELRQAQMAEYRAKPAQRPTPAPVLRGLSIGRPIVAPAPEVAEQPPVAQRAPEVVERPPVVAPTPAPVADKPAPASAPRPEWQMPWQMKDDGVITVAKPDAASPLTRATARGWLTHGEASAAGGRGIQANATPGDTAAARKRVADHSKAVRAKRAAQKPVLAGLANLRTAAETAAKTAQQLADVLPDFHKNIMAKYSEYEQSNPLILAELANNPSSIQYFEAQIEKRGAQPLLNTHRSQLETLKTAGDPLKKAIADGGSLKPRQVTALAGMHSALALAIGWIASAPAAPGGVEVAKKALAPAEYLPRVKAKARPKAKGASHGFSTARPQASPAKSPVFVPPQRGR
ncbi:MobA/MobL family protein, partial [Belnapia rosea]